MGLTVWNEVLELTLRERFVISRAEHGADQRVTTVIVEVRDDRHPGVVGLGEGFPDAYYGESPDTMASAVPALLERVDPTDLDFEPEYAAEALADISTRLFEPAGRGTGAARCALDTALHDLVGKVIGRPVHGVLGLSPVIPPTDFTLGIDRPEVVAERATRAAHFPALKVKVGGPADLETLEAVRGVYAGPIRVDANTGWTPDIAEGLLAELVRLGVELIEQPFPADRLDQLGWLQERSPLPIVADESAITIADLDGLVGVVAGVNVKLAKCGGIGPAKRMLERARTLGFRTFLGCMEETSLGIAASASVASLADWVDLDGNLLLADDPWEGLELGRDCRWLLSEAPGLGLRRRAA